MNIKSILTQYKHNIALVIGNGINRHNANSTNNSWDDLLQELSRNRSFMKDIPKGIALTEFYDLLVLKSGSGISDNDLKKELYSLMSKWKPEAHHKEITEWAMHNNSPILTTNFDNTLGNAANCELLKMTHVRKQFTDYYPWICYYGHTDLHDPCIGFGIWHINGMEYYRRSIRLGFTHYMGSVQRARSWIYERNKDRLFFDRDPLCQDSCRLT